MTLSLAQLVELGDAVGLDLLLAVDAEAALDLELDGQAVRVPAGLARHAVAAHRLVAREEVLEDARDDVVRAGPAVGRRAGPRRRRRAARPRGPRGSSRRCRGPSRTRGCARPAPGSRRAPRRPGTGAGCRSRDSLSAGLGRAPDSTRRAPRPDRLLAPEGHSAAATRTLGCTPRCTVVLRRVRPTVTPRSHYTWPNAPASSSGRGVPNVHQASRPTSPDRACRPVGAQLGSARMVA